MNLIVGATGLLGSEICRLLATEGKPVRGLVRSTSDRRKVETLQGLGAEAVLGDLKDHPSLVGACRGASAVISTVSATLSRQEGDSIEKEEAVVRDAEVISLNLAAGDSLPGRCRTDGDAGKRDQGRGSFSAGRLPAGRIRQGSLR